jgi:hypothetical protein
METVPLLVSLAVTVMMAIPLATGATVSVLSDMLVVAIFGALELAV